MAVDLNKVAKEMLKVVEKDHGVKDYEPIDLFKMMMTMLKNEGLSWKDSKSALRMLIDSDKHVCACFNSARVELPGVVGTAMAGMC